MNLDCITPVVTTHDEEPNIGRTLERLSWARRVVVVDSGSRDRTAEIVRRFPRAELVWHPFESHAAQWNWALDRAGLDTEWVLALDADYVFPDAFAEEVRGLQPAAGVSGYRAFFRYCIGGRPLRGRLYPPVTVLFRREGARYEPDGHAHRVKLPGRVEDLRTRVLHDDRKPFRRWWASQRRYQRLESEKIGGRPLAALDTADRLRKLCLAPLAAPFYYLLAKGLILDGPAGWRYAAERTLAESLLAFYLVAGARRAGMVDAARRPA
jgi:glycosyltransferase involved in cell wall biosynthesis